MSETNFLAKVMAASLAVLLLFSKSNNLLIEKLFFKLIFLLLCINILVSYVNASVDTAYEYVLMDMDSGRVLASKNKDSPRLIASITKIMTAIIAIEKCNLSEKATASEKAISSLEKGYTKADIQVGETFTIEELLNVLILQSANEAACIIAEHISGSTEEFAKLMNEKAKEIGCIELQDML